MGWVRSPTDTRLGQETCGKVKTQPSSAEHALPPATLLKQQAQWLAPARARLLRNIAIARRQRVLDLGAGRGDVTTELVRRAGGHKAVIALDRDLTAMDEAPAEFAGAIRVGGDGRHMPCPSNTFDLVFSQFTLLWIAPLPTVIQEIWRVLAPEGVLVALEPDYGGMIEYPPEISSRRLWTKGVARAGGDPYTGRKLPGSLAAQGFDVRVELLNELHTPSPTRFDFLRDLPLTDTEQDTLQNIERQSAALSGHDSAWQQIAHLPLFLITATKP
jgi:SAM-dependent methyltransferase